LLAEYSGKDEMRTGNAYLEARVWIVLKWSERKSFVS
jgi:hypothetical protein